MQPTLRAKPLTYFQEQFCHEYIKTGNASAAYRAVSPKAKNWKESAVWTGGSKMMALGKVAVRINELQAEAAHSALVTVDIINKKLETIYKEAREDKQFAVCVAAVMGQAKLFGFLVQKKEARAGLLDDLTYDQVRILDDLLNSVKAMETTGATIASVEQPAPAVSGGNAH